MASLIGVHGIWNFWKGYSPEDAAAHIAGNWRKFLRAGDLGELCDQLVPSAAYYAHPLNDPAVTGAQGDGDESADDTSLADALLLAWLDAVAPEPAGRQGPLTAGIRARLSHLATGWGLDSAVVNRVVRAACGEVARYFSPQNTAARARSRDEVIRAIAQAQPPRIVVAHSFGSVVAYEALHARADLEVDLWITLGSPLAMPDVVAQRLCPAPVGGRGHRPAGVRRWVNIADVGDVVAIPAGGIATMFTGITNGDDIVTTIGALACHGVQPYLGCAPVAAVIRGQLRSGSAR